MDMLTVGMSADSFIDSERKTNGCTMLEYKTHFAIWCLFASPLMIGCDVRNTSKEALDILMNKEAIAINQDPACNQVYQLTLDRGTENELVYARLLANGDFAIGAFNFNDTEYRFVFGLDEMGITTHCGKKVTITEIWSDKSATVVNGAVDETVEAHGCRMWRVHLEDK